MTEKNLTVFIPAIKKNVAFQDDLVKKIAEVTPIQRAIDKCRYLGVNEKNIHLITDSEDIRLIARRNRIGVYWDQEIVWDKKNIEKSFYEYFLSKCMLAQFVLILSPYGVLITESIIERAINALKKSDKEILKPVIRDGRKLFDRKNYDLIESIIGPKKQINLVECEAFILLKSKVIKNGLSNHKKIMPWEMGHEFFEIESFQDWWVCEKLLKRKRIVFRVIGNNQVGMGHIFRTLSLAHEITDHEVLFVCDYNNKVAVKELASYNYWLGIYKSEKIIEEIINLKPDLVINDILDTDKSYINKLKNNKIKIVNFEDLGNGAALTDLTINELFDEPTFPAKNIKWGHEYFFIRDEFEKAQPHIWSNEIKGILITFGGTDTNNLTQKTLENIIDFCEKHQIKIFVVTGPGYIYKKRLTKYLEISGYKDIKFTFGTGVISNIMEQTQIAISSNGRTVYELAHMNIPSIIISQHNREDTHLFANEKNGFINLGLHQKIGTESNLIYHLKELVTDTKLRRALFENMIPINFLENKKKVVGLITELLEQ